MSNLFNVALGVWWLVDRPFEKLSLARVRSVSKNLLLLISAGVVITLNAGEASAGRLDGFGKDTHKPHVLQFNKEACKKDFKYTITVCRLAAAQAGISEKTINEALPYTFKIDPEVTKLDHAQSGVKPKHKRKSKLKRKPKSGPSWNPNFKIYRDKFVTETRVAKEARYLLRDYWSVSKIEKKYGVDASVLLAIFGMETNFGRYKGNFDIIRSLVTLVHDGRRAKLFTKELICALKIVDEGHMYLKKLKGSWAGGMGHPQFLPSNYLKYAQDFNKDGKKDIWNTKSDALASMANLLFKNGYKKGAPIMEPVSLTRKFNKELMGTHQKLTIDTWSDWGVKFKKKHKSKADRNQHVSIIRLGGRWGQAFAVYDNFKVIKNFYNNSNAYATVVAILSQKAKKAENALRKNSKLRFNKSVAKKGSKSIRGSHKTVTKKRVNIASKLSLK